MNAAVVALGALALFVLAYRYYGTHLAKKVYDLNDANSVPSHTFKDGVDYVPTKIPVLWGHHFTTIAGAAPIVGPAIAVIWGWVPALLWVVFGTIFIGAVHDFGALVVSSRHKGRSIGEVTNDLVGPRARTLFLLVIFFLLLLVIAVFALVISRLFIGFRGSVISVWSEVPLALIVGYLIYRKNSSPYLPALISVAIMYFLAHVGTIYPFTMPAIFGTELMTWIVVLLAYAYAASTLPVGTLLQPRDFINGVQLVIGVGALYLAVFIMRPPIVAPAFNLGVQGAPLIIPFLFITIACGAISGFHSLVSSGTTVRQIDRESHMKPVGYGGMLGEGALATMAVLACTAGFATAAAWSQHYASWGTAAGKETAAFVRGGGYFLSTFGIPSALGTTILAVIVVSFAATTLDSATRIQRYIVSELATAYKVPFLTQKHPATLVAVISAFLLARIDGGTGGLILWPLFGTTNQLLAALALLTISLYLIKNKRPTLYTVIPMAFMLTMTVAAMVLNLRLYIQRQQWLLASFGGVILILAIWLVLEAVYGLRSARAASSTTLKA
ncbi:MAG: carbon starvation protein A [Bacillota bacterium]